MKVEFVHTIDFYHCYWELNINDIWSGIRILYDEFDNVYTSHTISKQLGIYQKLEEAKYDAINYVLKSKEVKC